MTSSTIPEVLSAGILLLSSRAGQTDTISSDLRSILASRLTRYYTKIAIQDVPDFDSSSLESLQFITAKEAFAVVSRVQEILAHVHVESSKTQQSDEPLIGTRDLSQLRTLLSIFFKWGLEPVTLRLISVWPGSSQSVEPAIIDLITTQDDYDLLSRLLKDVEKLLFPAGVDKQIAQTLITTALLQKHVQDVLRPCILVGWIPKSLTHSPYPALDDARPFAMRVLSYLPASQAITALGSLLSSSPSLPKNARKTCISLLSRQLMRPQGVRGLCSAVLDTEDINEDVPFDKLEHIARVLMTAPVATKQEAYFSAIIPKVLDLLSPEEPPAHRRAAAFTISRMLSQEKKFVHNETASKISISIIHKPFTTLPMEVAGTLNSDQPDVRLPQVIALVANMDPSPDVISCLLSPILPSLYSLLYRLDQIKTADPTLRESLRGLLLTWGKIVATADGLHTLWSIIKGEGGDWKLSLEGRIRKTMRHEDTSALALLTPQDVQTENDADNIFDINMLDLYPDPAHFSQFLKDIQRSDISSQLFVDLLEAYRTTKMRRQADPVQTLHYLHIIIQMQLKLSDNNSASNLLHKPAHLLIFIKHALDPLARTEVDQLDVGSIRLGDPEISAGDLLYEEDSDDEDLGILKGVDNEIVETALNLLLSILEANADLSARTEPVLNEIFSLIEPLARGDSDALRPLAQEARMVMTARLASGSAPSKSATSSSDDAAQETYQRALKLLQDPILPVRAHGLLLLRELVASVSVLNASPTKVDPALVPAILSIFLQSIRDEDSYIYLNAVQGLAVMVDSFGKDVLKGLVNEYREGLEGLKLSTLSQHDVDMKVRVGEALGSVIRRCGDTLSIYVDMLVPRFTQMVRSSFIPTTLRTSALSLLAECERTSPLAMLPYALDLMDAMIDLVQVESTPATQRPTTSPTESKEEPTMDTHPTSTDSKFPPLRRAALHFLSHMIVETTKRAYNAESSIISNAILSRAKTTLAYVAVTDPIRKGTIRSVVCCP